MATKEGPQPRYDRPLLPEDVVGDSHEELIGG